MISNMAWLYILRCLKQVKSDAQIYNFHSLARNHKFHHPVKSNQGSVNIHRMLCNEQFYKHCCGDIELLDIFQPKVKIFNNVW